MAIPLKQKTLVCAVFLISSLVVTTNAAVLFSTLPKTLKVTASPSGQVLKAGEDKISVTWSFDQSSKADDSSYKTIKVKLCYAPISQKDRPWRKTVDELVKDKTCQHKLISKPYAKTNNTLTETIEKDVPTASYFVRAYVYDQQGHEVGYGQTTDDTTHFLQIQGITGRHLSLDIASAAFSAFSVVSLAWFFYLEKKKAKKASQNS